MVSSNQITKFFLVAALLLIAGCQTFSTPAINLIERQENAFDLKTLEGKTFDLRATIENHDATVLVWWATQCPCVQRFQARMHALRENYPKESVAFIAVSSNVDDDIDRLRQVASDRQFQLPVVSDTRSALANALDVSTTPTVVLIDKSGNVRFQGWIDNERLPSHAGRVAYLQNAVDELLAGKNVTLKRSQTYGCMITKSMR